MLQLINLYAEVMRPCLILRDVFCFSVQSLEETQKQKQDINYTQIN
jgi:hypothetical protein